MDNTKCLITKEIIKKIAFDDSFKESLDNDGVVDGYISKFAAKPEMGFNFGYLIYIPISLITNPVLIVEGPSVGEIGPIEKACEIVYSKAVFELSTGGFPHFLAKKFSAPLLCHFFLDLKIRKTTPIFSLMHFRAKACQSPRLPLHELIYNLLQCFGTSRIDFQTQI